MTRQAKNQGKRRRSSCPISFALGIFGDRWSLLVLRDLILRDKRRFSELLAAPEGIATNVLTDRLRRLVDTGLVTRDPDPDDLRQWTYRPTEQAIDLVPMLLELIAWGVRNDPRAAAAVPADFIQRLHRDRQGLIESIQRRAASDVSSSSSSSATSPSRP